ncbi:macrolide 2'-phosphotransferase [Paenibacillus methanolicus]|uniref:Macrolide phosphotransferase n=1 Tax=Paenibacillus methanolicus TaxID=582686 RepID=A0A5S5C0G1_9BACL|nr:macrolide 2'-phosphotransferase [Paenibacillus methanolicus]TYP71946.1 macrolide phosphotransferase [Paenibacillus methanolicus]
MKTPNKTSATVERMLDLAIKHGIEVDAATVKINESGLDFLAVFADDKDGMPWVLRSPRREDVIESAGYEHKVLQLAANHMSVSVPAWEVYTPELIAYRKLQGTPMGTINPEASGYDWYLDPQNIPDGFIQSLAETLASLHGIAPELALQAGVRVKQPNQVREALAVHMDEVKRSFGVSRALWERWQRWLADESYWPQHSGLVHGDLHPGHILVDPQGNVTGLLDWTEGEVSDPATDFTIYHTLFGDEGLADLLKRYEQAGGRVWPRMHEHIVERMAAYPVLIAIFAMKSGLAEYKAMAQNALGVNERGEELPTEPS